MFELGNRFNFVLSLVKKKPVDYGKGKFIFNLSRLLNETRKSEFLHVCLCYARIKNLSLHRIAASFVVVIISYSTFYETYSKVKS